MDRVDIGAGGWQPGLLPESASWNHWRLRRDEGIEEVCGNRRGQEQEERHLEERETGWGKHWPESHRMGGAPHRTPRATKEGRQSQQQC